MIRQNKSRINILKRDKDRKKDKDILIEKIMTKIMYIQSGIKTISDELVFNLIILY
jgi:hypothetical protein